MPKGEFIVAKHLGKQNKKVNGKVEKVSLLGSNDEIKWTQNETGLKIAIPKNIPDKNALAFKVEL